ncbi:MAG: hypothetical protein U0P45_06800 [Acidimicrobiales bacterium]
MSVPTMSTGPLATDTSMASRPSAASVNATVCSSWATSPSTWWVPKKSVITTANAPATFHVQRTGPVLRA